jgi:hypothetical protein
MSFLEQETSENRSFASRHQVRVNVIPRKFPLAQDFNRGKGRNPMKRIDANTDLVTRAELEE